MQDLRLNILTSSFNELQSFRANVRPRADPYTGMQNAKVWSVSVFKNMSNVQAIQMFLTFVALEPAVNLSKNTGIAKEPNAGVAPKHRLKIY